MFKQFNFLQPYNSEEEITFKEGPILNGNVKTQSLRIERRYELKVDVNSLFNDNIFISIDDFNAKFGAKINILSHRPLKKL